MSYESPLIECQRCSDTEGPFERYRHEQFSASGAKPTITVYYCETCVAQLRSIGAGRSLFGGKGAAGGH